uniref:BHLH domain-containing protein n=3 Tax=Fusarium oxysporum TaxID=5507 RepID=A0A0C4BL12_FUSOF
MADGVQWFTGSDMSQTTVPPQSLTAGISEQLERTPPEVKMRSASHKLKKVHKKPGLPAHVLQARECYNNMEKQYRTRLKLRFEGLLAVLEACKMRDEAVGEGDPEAPDFGYSRGEVLDAARQRVLTLEEENRHLSTQLSDLNKTLMSQ